MIRKAMDKKKDLKCPHSKNLFRSGLQPCSLVNNDHTFCNGWIVYNGVLCYIFEKLNKC
jgi:hypothetical protein